MIPMYEAATLVEAGFAVGVGAGAGVAAGVDAAGVLAAKAEIENKVMSKAPACQNDLEIRSFILQILSKGNVGRLLRPGCPQLFRRLLNVCSLLLNFPSQQINSFTHSDKEFRKLGFGAHLIPEVIQTLNLSALKGSLAGHL
jgi:hypothetical protein